MYKNNSRLSSKFKGCSPLQLSCNLTRTKPAIGYYSYTNRCRKTQEKTYGSGLGIYDKKIFKEMALGIQEHYRHGVGRLWWCS